MTTVQCLATIDSCCACNAASSSSAGYVFEPGAVEHGLHFGDWAAMCASIATLPAGTTPTVTFYREPALGPGTTTIPLAGMPPGGWDMRGGDWRNYFFGNNTFLRVAIPPGVMIDNLSDLTESMALDVAPALGDHVLNFSLLPPMMQVTFTTQRGSSVNNQGLGAFIEGDGTGRAWVFSGNLASFFGNPPLTGPLLKLPAGGLAVATQFSMVGGFPPGWLEGDPAAACIALYDSTASLPTEWGPAWAGIVAFEVMLSRALATAYTPGVPADWGVQPSTVQQALDQIAAALGPIP